MEVSEEGLKQFSKDLTECIGYGIENWLRYDADYDTILTDRDIEKLSHYIHDTVNYLLTGDPGGEAYWKERYENLRITKTT